MLSRVAQAPRLATAAARLSRPAVSPILRARPAAATISPWIRTYAANQGKPGQRQPPSKPPQSGATSSAQSQGSSAKDASPSSQPRDDSVGAAEEQPSPDASKDAEQIPFHKLPDLTQGIPSTLEQEIRQQTGRSQAELEAVDQEDAEGRERRDRRESYVSTSERNRRWWTRFMLLTTAVGSGFGILYMGRNWEDVIEAERHPDVPNGWSPTLWWQRVKARMGESVSYYQDPAFDKLLPDPDPSFERPYTLCLSLDDLLVHSEWSREHGWRVAKRPGMDYFIRYLSQYYELVLFTTVPFAMGEPLVRKLDPFRFIMWPLYREATKYEDGEIVKVGCASSFNGALRR